MERAEYMRIKGELVTATELLTTSRTEKSKTQSELQSWMNALHSEKLTQSTAEAGHALIDKLLTLQQQQIALEAQEFQFKKALQGVKTPAL